jgi:hypothetical protein
VSRPYRNDGRSFGDRRGGPARRVPPPAVTGLEGRYLEQCKLRGSVLTVVLGCGTTVRGPIEDFDRDVITIRSSEGSLTLRKADIRYLSEAAGTG